MKKLGRKLVGILLAASMTAAAVFPIQGVAAEGKEYQETGKRILTEDTAADTQEGQHFKEEMKSEILEEGQQEEGKIKPEVLEEESKPENPGQETSGNTKEEGTEPRKEAAQPENNPQVTEEAEKKTFMLPQENREENITPLTDKYDIDQPVIESFEFLENGQALTVDDTLHFKMSAYDADSGIRSIVVKGDCGNWWSVTLEASEETKNLYEGSLSCSELKGTSGYISSIRVTDMTGNYTDWETWENGQYRYTFTVNNKIEDGNISVSNFQMQAKSSNADGKLRVGDRVTYTADVLCEKEEIESCNMYLYPNADNYSGSEWVDVSYDASSQKLTGTYTVRDNTYPAEWKLGQISIYAKSGNNYYFDPQYIEPDADLKFTVVQENFDTEKPVIEDVTIDKNGQLVKSGETVTIRVKVKEENPSSAAAYIYPQVTNVSADPYVGLTYEADTSEYVGTINITEDTYPCEWALTDLWISDEVGHSTHLSDFKSDYSYTYPWYYKVESKNTYREDAKDVTFEFYGFAQREDGGYQLDSLISTKTVEVGRRATLKDLGVSFPQSLEGVGVEWKGHRYWGDEGFTIKEDTGLLFDSTSDMVYRITATYDKGCANVSLTYMSKNSGRKTVCIPIFVDKEATYKDVLNKLKLPEDAQTEEFVQFEIGEFYDENTLVGDMADFSVEAKYKNCQVSWNTRYIGKDGKETSKVINKSYLEGMSVSDALADLEQPESAKDMEFEAWVLTSSDAVQTITQPMANIDVAAVYRGKTTVDASCTYRGEDGIIATDKKLILLDGEDLKDAELQGEASEAFKDVNHLKGLRLSEWTSKISFSQGRYQAVQFQALYSNCVVTLKFPDHTCQYIVVEKGASYALPTECEKYRDIIWEGYEKGATVTIDKDTEFTVKEYKDGPEEETGGVRLSAKEIAEIVEKVKNATEGDTITIDMNKATVIPKEVQEAIQGKSVNIVLKMDGYSWTINGTNVVATNLKDIDLEVKIDTDAIPSNLVTSISGGKPATQISLTHNGEFGFRADLTLNLGGENSGSTANLYYYDSSGKLVFINSGQVGTDGSTSLPFSHASDYVIVIDNQASDPEDESREDNDGDFKKGKQEEKDNETANIKKKKNTTTADSNQSKADNTDSGKMKSPKTGE